MMEVGIYRGISLLLVWCDKIEIYISSRSFNPKNSKKRETAFWPGLWNICLPGGMASTPELQGSCGRFAEAGTKRPICLSEPRGRQWQGHGESPVLSSLWLPDSLAGFLSGCRCLWCHWFCRTMGAWPWAACLPLVELHFSAGKYFPPCHVGGLLWESREIMDGECF